MSPPFPLLAQRLVVQLGDVGYYVRSRVECELPIDTPAPATSPAPAVVISIPDASISLDAIKEKFSRFESEDDVFDKKFTTGGYLILQHLTEQPQKSLPRHLVDFLPNNSIKLLTLKGKLPEGPYSALGKALHQAWRLYPDVLTAFATVVIPDDEDPHKESFNAFHTGAFSDSVSCVSVPSRLYFKKTESRPLAGLRIAIKDNMHLAGVVTGLANRAFAELYGKQTGTAKYVQLLQQKGAVILGKTKLSAFAGSEVPPNQCIDYFPPWNARGDGYQGPSGSSSGAATRVTGYTWVDISLCTDISGSMRFPASSHGTWAHRVSWGTLPMEGIVPSVPIYDNIGLLGRTPEGLQELLAVTHKGKEFKKHTRLIYPTDWYPLANEAQQAMTEAFIKAVEDYLGITHVKMSLLDEWSKTAKDYLGIEDTSLIDFLEMVSSTHF